MRPQNFAYQKLTFFIIWDNYQIYHKYFNFISVVYLYFI